MNKKVSTCCVLGVNIAALNMDSTLDYIQNNLEELRGKYICVSNIHTTIMSYDNAEYCKVQNNAALALPDGGPLSVVCRKHGFKEASRVTGPDLMGELFELSNKTTDRQYRHYFYGGTQDSLDKMREQLKNKYPNLQICGMYSPPFRPLTEEEDRAAVEAINKAEPDFVWVGLGAPKQENWMAQHENQVNGVMLGVGAGFDYYAGKIKRAPKWMQKCSMEWFYRLIQDPKRLWKRYLSTNGKFVLLFLFGKNKIFRKYDYYNIEKKLEMRHIFIIGSKGIPSRYGGFETFVENLTKHQKNTEIKYHVSCIETEEMRNQGTDFEHNGAHCFQIKLPSIGAAKAVLYDILSFRKSIRMIKAQKIENPIVYVLACRIGPFVGHYKRKLHKLGGKYYVNPDGHEWKRGKWNALIKKYWKLSEKLMIKHADFVICDSKNIESYIQHDYAKYKPRTTFIAYGADVEKSAFADDDKKFTDWMKEKDVLPNEYYLLVGRLVPENNYETVLREFVKSDTKKKLVLITTLAKQSYMDRLKENTGYTEDDRVIFAGTVYDSELLKKIRENAFAYIHGHEVGGTNPSLLEALGSTKLNILLNVGFNKEVAEDGAIYFNKEDGNLRKVMKDAESFTKEQILDYESKAKNRVKTQYSHEMIVDKYEKIFTEM